VLVLSDIVVIFVSSIVVLTPNDDFFSYASIEFSERIMPSSYIHAISVSALSASPKHSFITEHSGVSGKVSHLCLLDITPTYRP